MYRYTIIISVKVPMQYPEAWIFASPGIVITDFVVTRENCIKGHNEDQPGLIRRI
jgi:hypothetical protein